MSTASKKRRSQEANEKSDALDLDKACPPGKSAKRIAASLKSSAERGKRRKAIAFRSAMSMLTFRLSQPRWQRLPQPRKAVLERAKDGLQTRVDRVCKKR